MKNRVCDEFQLWLVIIASTDMDMMDAVCTCRKMLGDRPGREHKQRALRISEEHVRHTFVSWVLSGPNSWRHSKSRSPEPGLDRI